MLKLFKCSFLLLFFSCNIITFEQLDTDISVNAKSAYYEQENIEINFSSAMQTQSVERIINLKKDGSTQNTDIFWQDCKCFVKPVGGFCFGERYEFSLKGEVKTKSGGVYSVDISRKFIFGNKENIFCIEDFIEPRAFDSSLEFSFNRELDIASFEQTFKISPHIEFKKEYSHNAVKLVPKSQWQNNTFYTWTIENACSKDGYKIFKTYSGTFMAVNENERPKILFVCPVDLNEEYDASSAVFSTEYGLDNLFGAKPLGIVFSKPMDFESVKSAMHFEPSISGRLLQKDAYNYIYCPYENYQIKKEYLLSVNSTAKDIYGVEMEAQRNFYFTTSNDFLKITSITANNTALEKDKRICVKASNEENVFVNIYFSAPIPQKNYSLAQNAISLAAYFSNIANPPKLNSFTVNSNCVQIHWSNLSKSSGADYIYKLKITGGKNYITNSANEYLEEDECYYIIIN